MHPEQPHHSILLEKSTPPIKLPLTALFIRGLWGYVLPLSFFASIVVLVIYAAPALLHHWRMAELETEAEAIFQKRRAELRAEAQHADERLKLLDQKTPLVALGFREVVRKVSPSVVSIQHLTHLGSKEADAAQFPLVIDPEENKKYLQTGLGSGIVLDKGWILTNQHVIQGAHRLRVTFASGQSIGLPGDAAVTDAMTDLAVVKLPADLPKGIAEDLNFKVEFADSDKDVRPGDFALAVGSPLGLQQTVSQGIISAKGRFLQRPLVELLQTDAAIHPGNSGGPLFDQLGRVVGINVAIASDTGRNMGIGFAIPSNTARKVFEKLTTEGEVARGYLGIALDELSTARAKELNLEDSGGVTVTRVETDQAASKAGIQQGDVIIRFNNDWLARQQAVRHLRQLIAEVPPGVQVTVDLIRAGERQRCTVTVGKRPSNLP